MARKKRLLFTKRDKSSITKHHKINKIKSNLGLQSIDLLPKNICCETEIEALPISLKSPLILALDNKTSL